MTLHACIAFIVSRCMAEDVATATELQKYVLCINSVNT